MNWLYLELLMYEDGHHHHQRPSSWSSAGPTADSRHAASTSGYTTKLRTRRTPSLEKIWISWNPTISRPTSWMINHFRRAVSRSSRSSRTSTQAVAPANSCRCMPCAWSGVVQMHVGLATDRAHLNSARCTNQFGQLKDLVSCQLRIPSTGRTILAVSQSRQFAKWQHPSRESERFCADYISRPGSMRTMHFVGCNIYVVRNCAFQRQAMFTSVVVWLNTDLRSLQIYTWSICFIWCLSMSNWWH